jgi:hypothetical protein
MAGYYIAFRKLGSAMKTMYMPNQAESGSRWHFVLAVIVAVVISIGLTSTAAKAGLIPAMQAATQFDDDMDDAAPPATPAAADQHTGSYQPAVIATPALLVGSGGASELAVRPFLEEEEEFAPRFQHVVARGRPGRNPLNVLGCALSMTRHCGQATRL